MTQVKKKEYAEMIMDYRLEADTYSTANPAFATNGAFDGGLSPDFVQAVDSLWHDPIIPSVLDRSSITQLTPSLSHQKFL